MVFGTVIFSLLAQGLSIAALRRLLKFVRREPVAREYELVQGQLLADTAAIAEVGSTEHSR